MFLYLFLGWIFSNYASVELDRQNKDIHKRITKINEKGEIWRKKLREERLKEIENFIKDFNKES